MIIKFQKFQAAGNDFIIIDNRNLLYDFTTQIVEHLCHRKFGIGADGLMLLESYPGYNFHMRYFNSDGKEASMCGNGGRCIAAFAHRLGLFEKAAHFMAADGPHEVRVTPDSIQLKMCNVTEVIIQPGYYFLNTGSPHYVCLVEDAFRTDVFHTGRQIRNLEQFQPEGTNVNFITLTPSYIKVATYERGVEDETLACGTGCVASALVAGILRNDTLNTYAVKTKGGNLKVSFERHDGSKFTNIWLEGPAELVFSGEITI